AAAADRTPPRPPVHSVLPLRRCETIRACPFLVAHIRSSGLRWSSVLLPVNSGLKIAENQRFKIAPRPHLAVDLSGLWPPPPAADGPPQPQAIKWQRDASCCKAPLVTCTPGVSLEFFVADWLHRAASFASVPAVPVPPDVNGPQMAFSSKGPAARTLDSSFAGQVIHSLRLVELFNDAQSICIEAFLNSLNMVREVQA